MLKSSIRISSQAIRLLLAAMALVAGASHSGAASPGESHAELFRDSQFPSATECRTCHPDHYREWSVSSHAYAQLSPVFNAMQAKILKLTNGTNGDFCIRCHTAVGMTLEEPVFASNLDRSAIAREGITCVVCHRVSQEYGKVSGRRALRAGDLTQPINGPTGNEELRRVLSQPDRYKVVTDPTQPGRPIHRDVVPFFQLTEPAFCGSCHDVNLLNGFRLEEAFSEYRTSPAAKRGVTCQDCHMGIEPGVASPRREGPAAIVGGVPTEPRRRSDHMFAGPDHSVVHPALFPHNPDAEKLASIADWLRFDHEAGWGTDEFEDQDLAAVTFPERWSDAEDRFDGREVIDVQQELLAEAARQRARVLRAGFELGAIEVTSRTGDLRFNIEVKNATDGHNVPTGFVAERLVFLRVEVKDATGATVFRSGDLDPAGDLRDSHSSFVDHGELPRDDQLFNLQSKFITRNLRGGEREQVLAVNQSLDPLPFVRPEIRSTILIGRPLEARIHKLGIEPLGSRVARYRVKSGKLGAGPPFSIDIALVAGMVPVNLIQAIQSVGFDYGLSAAVLAERIVAGHLVLHEQSVVTPGGEPGPR